MKRQAAPAATGGEATRGVDETTRCAFGGLFPAYGGFVLVPDGARDEDGAAVLGDEGLVLGSGGFGTVPGSARDDDGGVGTGAETLGTKDKAVVFVPGSARDEDKTAGTEDKRRCQRSEGVGLGDPKSIRRGERIT